MKVAHLALLVTFFLAGCSGLQSSLAPAGPDARDISTLSWWMFGGATLVTLLVLALTAWAVWGGERRPAWLADHRLIFIGGLVLPTLVLLALLVPSLMIAARQTAPDSVDLRIRVVGEQWWWRVQYLNADGTVAVETANEIHIPVAAKIAVELTTADVIHSFWVPALGGKRDMIPGQTNVLYLEADQPGLYRGQCAEYCGGAHALMSFYVVAESRDAFAAWRAAQQRAVLPSSDGDQSAGQALFLASGCGACHTVRGTPATGRIGPDLTHVGGRGFIAGGTLATTRDNLRAWITDSQTVKPHNRMPAFGVFDAEHIAAISTWLESLK